MVLNSYSIFSLEQLSCSQMKKATNYIPPELHNIIESYVVSYYDEKSLNFAADYRDEDFEHLGNILKDLWIYPETLSVGIPHEEDNYIELLENDAYWKEQMTRVENNYLQLKEQIVLNCANSHTIYLEVPGCALYQHDLDHSKTRELKARYMKSKKTRLILEPEKSEADSDEDKTYVLSYNTEKTTITYEEFRKLIKTITKELYHWNEIEWTYFPFRFIRAENKIILNMLPY